MSASKQNSQNHVKTPKDSGKNPNRLLQLGNRFPTMKILFKQFFRDNGVGDIVYGNIERNRQKLTPVHDRIIDRMVTHYNITEK